MSKTLRQVDDGPPPRRNRAQSIGIDLQPLGRQALMRAGFVDGTLVLRWEDIVGPDLARLARPMRFVDNSSGGVLTLRAEPGASVFLQHESRQLCDRINAYLGRPAVRRIRFVFRALASGARSAPAVRAEPKPAPARDPARRFEGPENLKIALLGLATARRSGTGNRGD